MILSPHRINTGKIVYSVSRTQKVAALQKNRSKEAMNFNACRMILRKWAELPLGLIEVPIVNQPGRFCETQLERLLT
jgi:hypothetical protein